MNKLEKKVKGGYMKKESILYVMAGLLLGVVITSLIAVYVVSRNQAAANMNNNDMAMCQMGELKSKSGDEFDKAFLSDMITHHQAAIDMALLAQTNAKHNELKALARDILSAQSKEIEMMKSWQTQWGYQTQVRSHDMQNMSH